jgi:hypothetical protein
VERWVKRAGLNVEHIAGVDANRLADSIAMLRAPLQRLKDQEIECPLQELDSVLITLFHLLLASMLNGCRYSTSKT